MKEVTGLNFGKALKSRQSQRKVSFSSPRDFRRAEAEVRKAFSHSNSPGSANSLHKVRYRKRYRGLTKGLFFTFLALFLLKLLGVLPLTWFLVLLPLLIIPLDWLVFLSLGLYLYVKEERRRAQLLRLRDESARQRLAGNRKG